MAPQIVGAASTKYDKHPESSSRELFSEAAVQAFEQTSISPDDLDGYQRLGRDLHLLSVRAYVEDES